MTQETRGKRPFRLHEASIEDIRQGYVTKQISARELVQMYVDRIEALDRKGPAINSIITLSASAFDEADRLDAALRASGPVGPLHGVPVLLKDQIDAKGTPTTVGSKHLKDFYPDHDAFVVARLREAGAIILAKTTLGELGGGDTHGTLFGSTKNPYQLERTAGGSSGGSGAGVSANFGAVALGQEGFASIRRPSAWNGIVGMRASGGVVSRTGSFAGWPGIAGQLGPMGRSVKDVATVLAVIAGYDPEDPQTALGVGQVPKSFTALLDAGGLKGARIGVIRESMGSGSEPGSEDFKKVEKVFERAVVELARAGAILIDPVAIPQVNELLAMRTSADRGGSDAGWDYYYGRNAKRPYKTMQELLDTPGYRPMSAVRASLPAPSLEQENARETLTFNLLKLMADQRLDAIVHKTVEHQATLIKDGVNPPYVNIKGAIHVNTFVAYVPSITVPAGFTTDGLPAGITFLGRPYSDDKMIRYAYAYEQATLHRRAPESTPPLPGME